MHSCAALHFESHKPTCAELDALADHRAGRAAVARVLRLRARRL